MIDTRIIMVLVVGLIIFVVWFIVGTNKEVEGYDNLLPNEIRWSIYRATTKEDFDKVWDECRCNCKNKGFSELGCVQSCREHIKDRLFYLKNRDRNYLPTF